MMFFVFAFPKKFALNLYKWDVKRTPSKD